MPKLPELIGGASSESELVATRARASIPAVRLVLNFFFMSFSFVKYFNNV